MVGRGVTYEELLSVGGCFNEVPDFPFEMLADLLTR